MFHYIMTLCTAAGSHRHGHERVERWGVDVQRPTGRQGAAE